MELVHRSGARAWQALLNLEDLCVVGRDDDDVVERNRLLLGECALLDSHGRLSYSTDCDPNLGGSGLSLPALPRSLFSDGIRRAVGGFGEADRAPFRVGAGKHLGVPCADLHAPDRRRAFYHDDGNWLRVSRLFHGAEGAL